MEKSEFAQSATLFISTTHQMRILKKKNKQISVLIKILFL